MNSLTELLAVLDEKLDLFTDMLNLSQEQVALLQIEQLDEDLINRLVDILNKRQKLMDRIDHLSASISSLEQAAGIEPNNSGNSGSGLDQSEPYVNNINKMRSIILQIQANDLKCQNRAREVLEQTGDRLVSTRQTKKAFQAYNNTNACNQAWFFDKKR